MISTSNLFTLTGRAATRFSHFLLKIISLSSFPGTVCSQFILSSPFHLRQINFFLLGFIQQIMKIVQVESVQKQKILLVVLINGCNNWIAWLGAWETVFLFSASGLKEKQKNWIDCIWHRWSVPFGNGWSWMVIGANVENIDSKHKLFESIDKKSICVCFTSWICKFIALTLMECLSMTPKQFTIF